MDAVELHAVSAQWFHQLVPVRLVGVVDAVGTGVISALSGLLAYFSFFFRVPAGIWDSSLCTENIVFDDDFKDSARLAIYSRTSRLQASPGRLFVPALLVMKERRCSATSRLLHLRGQTLIGTSRSFAEAVAPRGEQDVTGTSRTSASSTTELAVMDGVQWPAGGQPHACPGVGQTSPLVGSSFVRDVVEFEGWPIASDFRRWAHRLLVCPWLLLFSRWSHLNLSISCVPIQLKARRCD